MNFVQKVYFNDKLLILTTDKEAYLRNNDTTNYRFFTGATEQNVKDALLEMDGLETSGVIITDSSEDALHKQLLAMYRPIDASGGLVFNEAGEILMIYRRGKWDLAKGKLDEGETIAECAVREVQEETGLQQLTLGEKVCDTYHVYTQKKEQLLKRTAWYRMQGTSADVLAPQKEENILEARWIAIKDLKPMMSNTYEAIREVLRTAGIKW